MKLKATWAILFIVCFSINLFAQNPLIIEKANSRLDGLVNVRDFCISANEDEIYFTVQSPMQEISQIAFMKKIKGEWTDPQLMLFSDKFSDLEPFLAHDQNTLYFVSNRPLSIKKDTAKDYDIWCIKRQNKESEWSPPINLGKQVNSVNNEFYPSVTLNGNLYFTAEMPNGFGKDDIYLCKYQNGTYLQPELLDSAINSSGYEFNAFVSLHEDFLIYTKYNSPGGLGSGDLYIARKDKNNRWTKPENLGNVINTKYMEYCPYYDENTGVLYFTSRRSNIQPKKFNNINEFNEYLSSEENGLSRIYKTKFSIKK